MKNIFTVDVENFEHRLAYSNFCKENSLQFPGSAINGVKNVISLLNHFSYKATFFVIGEIIEKEPQIVDLILSEGHEIANHTYYHMELSNFSTPLDFEKDLIKFDNLVTDISGCKPSGFRAPKWSINKDMNWVFDILRKNGYSYDASIFPSNGYGYGIPQANTYPYRVSSDHFLEIDSNSDFFEFPTVVLPFNNFNFPIKLRHYGYNLMSRAINGINRGRHPATLLLHSWEFVNPDNNLLKGSNFVKNFIRNYNIPCTKMLLKLFKKFEFTSIKSYMNEVSN